MVGFVAHFQQNGNKNSRFTMRGLECVSSNPPLWSFWHSFFINRFEIMCDMITEPKAGPFSWGCYSTVPAALISNTWTMSLSLGVLLPMLKKHVEGENCSV